MQQHNQRKQHALTSMQLNKSESFKACIKPDINISITPTNNYKTFPRKHKILYKSKLNLLPISKLP